ncbi:MAG: hypothetical protein JST84_16120 [Acidobacteria bacterium]|nr:hypothetical protein [Acidobacteriota bacterium]
MFLRKLLLLFCLTPSTMVFGQGRFVCPEPSSISIFPNKPNVYLAYEKTEQIAKPSQEGIQTSHSLRLQNNSKWAIKVNAVPGVTPPQNSLITKTLCTGARQVLVNETEVEVLYHVEVQSRDATPRPPIFINSQIHWEIWLAPGDALRFKVPSQDLNDDYSIKVSYSYEWEKIDVPKPKSGEPEEIVKYYDELLQYDAPEHLVYFRYYRVKEKTEK